MPLNIALIIFELVVMVLSISLHDCAQAWMANRLGDPTARMLGRMTFNPARHFDLLGTLIAAVVALISLVIVRHVNPDTTISLLTASALAMRHLGVSTEGLPGIFPLILFLYFCILVNLLLFVFNLLPFPFLDGGKILTHYLPFNAAKTYQSMSLYFMFGFFFLGFYVIQIFFFPIMNIFQALLFSL
jgi:Zn-dependent protease